MKRTMEEIFGATKIIAVVGASDKRHRESNKILRYLQKEGFEPIPVNPVVENVEGLKSYPSLAAIPSEFEIDIVNIFRRPIFVEDIVKESINRSLSLGHKRALIWTQLGVSSDEGRALADSFELEYVRNRCILVEHGMLTS